MNDTEISLEQVQVSEGIIISLPSWFTRPDFRAWLYAKNGPATWGKGSLWQQILAAISLKPKPTTYEDAFITFDNISMCDLDDPENALYGGRFRWEGSDSNLPKDIYQELGAILYSKEMVSGIIWLKPF